MLVSPGFSTVHIWLPTISKWRKGLSVSHGQRGFLNQINYCGLCSPHSSSSLLAGDSLEEQFRAWWGRSMLLFLGLFCWAPNPLPVFPGLSWLCWTTPLWWERMGEDERSLVYPVLLGWVWGSPNTDLTYSSSGSHGLQEGTDVAAPPVLQSLNSFYISGFSPSWSLDHFQCLSVVGEGE